MSYVHFCWLHNYSGWLLEHSSGLYYVLFIGAVYCVGYNKFCVWSIPLGELYLSMTLFWAGGVECCLLGYICGLIIADEL